LYVINNKFVNDLNRSLVLHLLIFYNQQTKNLRS
jgi:hypothetical protein